MFFLAYITSLFPATSLLQENKTKLYTPQENQRIVFKGMHPRPSQSMGAFPLPSDKHHLDK